MRPPRDYEITRLVGAPPVIDGRLDDNCWRTLGTWSGDFTQREPHEGAKGSLPTEIKVLYDDRAIYVAIRAYDPQVATRPRTMGARDEFTGDMVGINFDSYHDQRIGFEFDVTSGGSKIDLILRDDGGADLSWNAVWDVKTAVEADAWTAEFRIPLSQLRYPPGRDQTWGMHSWRWIGALQEESDWNLIPMDPHGWIHSFGLIHGLRDLPASRRLEIVPYATAKLHRYAAEPGNPFRSGQETRLEGGLDLKYGLSTNLTLDATVNPDFSQVDADPSEINLTTIETFHTEHRPFFLEGQNDFDFTLDDDRVFYSRRIGAAPHLSPPDDTQHGSAEANRILASAKLTGTTQYGLTLGVLHALVDRTTVDTIDGSGLARRVTVEPATSDSVWRAQQELQGGDTRIGGIVSSSLRRGSEAELQTLPRRAFAYGADMTRYFSGRTYQIDGRVIGTTVAGSPESITALAESPVHNYGRPDANYLEVDPAATRLEGNAGFLRAARVTGRWRGAGFVSWRSPGVDFNDLGYLEVADFRTTGAQAEYFDATAGSLLRRRDLRLKLTTTEDYGGETLERDATLESEFATMGGAYGWLKAGVQTAVLDTHVLRGGPALRLPDRYPVEVYAETSGGRPLQLNFSGDATTTAEHSALSLRAAPGCNWKPNDHLKLGFVVEWQRNRQPTQYAGLADSATGPTYLMGRLDQRVLSGTCRLNVNFTPAVSLSYYGGPFVTTGRYTDFKVVARPRADAMADRFDPVVLGPAAAGQREGTYRGAPLRLSDPDFNWREFKSNLVFRWEYRPGSSAYLVWSQYRSDATDVAGFSAASQYGRLFSAHPDNTFLVKFSYWFSI